MLVLVIIELIIILYVLYFDIVFEIILSNLSNKVVVWCKKIIFLLFKFILILDFILVFFKYKWISNDVWFVFRDKNCCGRN